MDKFQLLPVERSLLNRIVKMSKEHNRNTVFSIEKLLKDVDTYHLERLRDAKLIRVENVQVGDHSTQYVGPTKAGLHYREEFNSYRTQLWSTRIVTPIFVSLITTVIVWILIWLSSLIGLKLPNL